MTLYEFSRSRLAFGIVLLVCMFVFPRLLSHYSAQSFSEGDVVGGQFYVAVTKSDSEQPIELLPLAEALQSSRPLVTQPQDWIRQVGEYEMLEYRVLESTDDGTIIETIRSGDDYTFTSHYRVANGKITPLYHRIFGPGHGLTGFPLAIVACSLLFSLLRWYTKSDHIHRRLVRFIPK